MRFGFQSLDDPDSKRDIQFTARRREGVRQNSSLNANGACSLSSRGAMEEKGWGEEAVFIGRPLSLTRPVRPARGEGIRARAGRKNWRFLLKSLIPPM